MRNFVKRALQEGGLIRPLIVPANLTNGLGIMNPSIFNDNGVLRGIIRGVNYTFYHSEAKLFLHPWGPLTYLHPENDLHLRTTNYYCEFDADLQITRLNKIDMSFGDTYEPKWEFVGLEDARIFRWDGKLYISGVRRDTTTNGEGRMELSEIEVGPDTVKEISRFRIPPPLNPTSYCEKNWMPILSMPYHYVKWCAPTEIVKVDPIKQTSEQVLLAETSDLIRRDLRGGSQVIDIGDRYLTLTHEVDLFKSDVGRKDAVYHHRFILWDKNWRMIRTSREFSFMDAHVEFAIGMTRANSDNGILITFGFQDNAAYVLQTSIKTILDFVNSEPDKTDSIAIAHVDPLRKSLYDFIDNPGDSDSNFTLALQYDGINQTASAISFYIRAAERSSDLLLQYEALIRAAMCFDRQGTRGLSVRGLLQRAISILPKRPEAHFLLARFHERTRDIESWVNCYTQASLALEICDFDSPLLRTLVDYPGAYGLLFEKAVSAWWVGLCEDSKNHFIDLMKNHPLDRIHRQACIVNLKFMNQFETKVIRHFDQTKQKRLRYAFRGSESISENYSESYQDMFILSILNGKCNGSYVEIGSGHPTHGNNTYLLEKHFGWKGVSIDISPESVKNWKPSRLNPCICADATQIDYEGLINICQLPAVKLNHYDYLQLDIDPPENTLLALKRIPLDKIRFSIITFEHDQYTQVDSTILEESRSILRQHGYVLVVANIAPDDWRNYEDWWVHPAEVDPVILATMLVSGDETKCAENYMLSR